MQNTASFEEIRSLAHEIEELVGPPQHGEAQGDRNWFLVAFRELREDPFATADEFSEAILAARAALEHQAAGGAT